MTRMTEQTELQTKPAHDISNAQNLSHHVGNLMRTNDNRLTGASTGATEAQANAAGHLDMGNVWAGIRTGAVDAASAVVSAADAVGHAARAANDAVTQAQESVIRKLPYGNEAIDGTHKVLTAIRDAESNAWHDVSQAATQAVFQLFRQ